MTIRDYFEAFHGSILQWSLLPSVDFIVNELLAEEVYSTIAPGKGLLSLPSQAILAIPPKPQTRIPKASYQSHHFFYRKQQRNILIELRSTKEGWWILPQKKTKQQEYKNKKLNGNNKKQTLFARPPHWSYTLLVNLVATH